MKDDRKIKIIVVDDHPILLYGIVAALRKYDAHIEVAGSVSSGTELLDKLREGAHPDLILLDILMPGMSGIDVAELMQQEFPDINILMFSSEGNNETIIEAAQRGVKGFVTKTEPIETLINAIETVGHGYTFFGDDMARLIEIAHSEKRPEDSIFTPRELDVVVHCCDGLLSKEIADRLNISQRTVENHKANIFRKLGISTTVELVKYAIKAGIIKL